MALTYRLCPQTDKFTLHKSSKFDKIQFGRITRRLYNLWKKTGDRDEAKENSGGRCGKIVTLRNTSPNIVVYLLKGAIV